MTDSDSFTKAVSGYIADEIMSKAIGMGFLKSLGYQDHDGNIDSDRLCEDLKERLSMGTVILHFPFLGDIGFSASDVEEFRSHLVR